MTDKPRKGPGRPVEKEMPEPIPDTPENVMRALLRGKPRAKDDWDYLRREKSGG